MSSESFILVKINRIVQTVVIWLRGEYESCFSGVERIIQDLQLSKAETHPILRESVSY